MLNIFLLYSFFVLILIEANELPPYWTMHTHQGQTYTGASQWSFPETAIPTSPSQKYVIQSQHETASTVTTPHFRTTSGSNPNQEITGTGAVSQSKTIIPAFNTNQTSRLASVIDVAQLQLSLEKSERTIEELRNISVMYDKQREELQIEVQKGHDVRQRLEARLNQTAQEREATLTKIDELESLLEDMEAEMEAAESDKQELARTITSLQDSVVTLEKLLEDSDRNQTLLRSELRISKSKQVELESALRQAEQNLDQMTEDIRYVSGSGSSSSSSGQMASVARGKGRKSMLNRILGSFLPSDWSMRRIQLNKALGLSGREAKGASGNGTVVVEDGGAEGGSGEEGEGETSLEGEIALLITSLRRNVTELTEALERKEGLAEELEGKLLQFQSEAEDRWDHLPSVTPDRPHAMNHRRGAYAALKEAVDSLSADRDHQAEVAATRGFVVMALQRRLLKAEAIQRQLYESLEYEVLEARKVRRELEEGTDSRLRQAQAELAIVRATTEIEANKTSDALLSLRISESNLLTENALLRAQLNSTLQELDSLKLGQNSSIGGSDKRKCFFFF